MNDANVDTKANTEVEGRKKLNMYSLCPETSVAIPPLFHHVCVTHTHDSIHTQTQVYNLKFEKMSINHFYRKM